MLEQLEDDAAAADAPAVFDVLGKKETHGVGIARICTVFVYTNPLRRKM